MSLAVIVGLCACLAAPPGKLAFAMLRASAVVLEQEQPGGSAPALAQTQAQQEPAKPANEGKSEPQTAPQPPRPQSAAPQPQTTTGQQAKPESSTESQPGLQPPVAPPAQPQAKALPGSSKKPGKVPSKLAAKKTAARKPTASKPTAAKKPASGPAKVVISNGSAADPQVEFAPTVTKQQANAALQNTNSLLDATDANLKKLSNRQLSPPQQDIVTQIRAYMQQAKAAAGEGDVQQATNLAAKARMLSDELVKP